MNYSSLISAEETLEHINDPHWRIIDCQFDLKDKAKGFQNYKSAHIPSAIFADIEKDLSSPVSNRTGRHPLPAINKIRQQFGNLGIQSNTQVVVYDDAFGSFAARLWWLLKWYGHQNVALLNGGLSYWKQMQFPLSREIPVVKPTVYTGEPDMSMIVDAETIFRSLNSSNLTLIDVRDSKRFQGLQEPIDRVAGHIPGAINIPWKTNLDDQGLFLERTELLSNYEEVLNNQSSDNFVFMCGSGITACHSLVAMHYLGKNDAKLYPGSWSEWIENPDLPIQTSS